MLISTKGRYALRLLADIAAHPSDEYVKLKDVAARQGISEKYLESIVKVLVKGGILTGARGARGGYRLARDAGQITAWQVLLRTEGSLAAVSCQKDGAEPCGRMADCPSAPIWLGLDRLICDYLSGYSIADLVKLETPT